MDAVPTAARAASTPRLGGGRGRASAATWPAVVAWGAGLIQLALGAGAITAPDGATLAAVPLIALGATALAWGSLVLARGRIIAPRVAVAGALAGLGAGAVALWADPVRTTVAAVAAASFLLVAVGFACGRALRAGWVDAAPPRLAGLVVAAVVVAAIVTPALAATEAGRHAHDHGAVVVGGHGH